MPIAMGMTGNPFEHRKARERRGQKSQTGHVANLSRPATPSREEEERNHGKRQRLKWTKQARDLVRTYTQECGERHRLVTALSEISGYPRRACLRFARQMGFENKRFYKEWTEREIADLMRLYKINTPRMLAAKLTRPVQSVRAKLRRLGITAQIEEDKFTKYTLASLLHVRPEVIQEWVDKRWLKAHREGTKKLPRIIVKARDFVQFAKRHHDVILRRRVNEDRLEFIYRFVFPRDYTDLLDVREHKKERVVHTRRVSMNQGQSHSSEDSALEIESPDAFRSRATVGERSKAARVS